MENQNVIAAVHDVARDHKTSILLIDDNPIDRLTILRSLKKIPDQHFEIVESETCREGIALALTHQFDCIVVDHYLLDGNSLDVLSELKEHHLEDKIPVVVLTGKGDELVATRVMKAGASDYIPKDKATAVFLKRSIDNAIEGARLRSALQAKHVALRETNALLLEKTSEVESFYHNVSHELKTPLTAAREFASLLIEEVAGSLNKEQKEYAQICIDNCDRATFYINSLLDLIRSDTGKLDLDSAPVHVKSILEDAIKNVLPTADKKLIRIKLSVKTHIDYLRADDKRIYQVLINLLNNAIKFTDEGGTITVKAYDNLPRRDGVIISVKDNGRGIHPNNLDKIFDRYYQADTLNADNPHSLGIGLHLCQTIVEMHGGDIEVQSGLGMGSTFIVTIPCWLGEQTSVVPRFVQSQTKE